ncbi:Spindle pole protein, putative [Giardia lamblia P15]|uniref:Spindle pole protein, putative n=1 Tax=Giardia intestinalis (strain P15) TaxID=658858 RepID=E1EZG8_GIAIA|nr:Spindle pole protein, putative [Giardia lamblia P15]
MCGSGVLLDPVPNTADGNRDAGDAAAPFLFKMTLDPIKNMQALLSDNDSDLSTTPVSMLLSKYACLRGASRALLVHSVDLEKKLAIANAEIDRLRACLQTPPLSSFSVQPSLMSVQATPELFTVCTKKIVRPRSSDHHQRPSLRTSVEHDSKHILQHRPYTMLEEIQESVSSRSTSLNSASSRRASISGPSGTRVPSSKGRSASTSSHTLNSTVAGIPSIASVTKGPYPAHASVLTNLYRRQHRYPSVKSSTIGSKRRAKTLTACSPRRLSFVSSPSSVTSIKKRLRRTKNERSLENILWAITGDNKLMKREIATLQEKFENVTAALESFTRVSTDQRESQGSSVTVPCSNSIPINRLPDLSVSTPIDTANELHSGETVSIDCSTINPILSTLHKPANKTCSSTITASGQHSLIIPPRYAISKEDKERSLTATLEGSVDMLMECPLDLQVPTTKQDVGETAHASQPSYLQQIYYASHQQTLEQQNSELREKNKKLKGMLTELKRSFNQGNISAIIEDNDVLVTKVNDLERKLFVYEASAARAHLTAEATVPNASTECATQTDAYLGYADKGPRVVVATFDQKAIQVESQQVIAQCVPAASVDTQSTLTARDLDLTMSKLVTTETMLVKVEAKLAQECEHSLAIRNQLADARSNALDYLQEATNCKEELSKAHHELKELTKENLRLNRELLSMDTALEKLQAAPAPPLTISLATQTEHDFLERETIAKDDSVQDLMAENVSLMERLRLLSEELLDASAEKAKVISEAAELQKKYDTLHAYAYSQHATYTQLSEEQLSTMSMQQKILSLEEQQRESEATLQKANEIQQIHTTLTQEVWRVRAENERLSRANTKLTDELRDFKRKTSEALKEHLKTTIDLEKHRLLEEEATSLRAALEKLKNSSDRQFQAMYAEKKDLEATITQLRTAKTDDENTLVCNALNLEKRLQCLELEHKASLEENKAITTRAEVAELRLNETLGNLQRASDDCRRLQEVCAELQNRTTDQTAIIAGQQQELQSIQLTLHDEVLGLQARIKELEEDKERLAMLVRPLRTDQSNKQSQTSPYTTLDVLAPERVSLAPRGTASKAVDDAHVKLVLENAHLRQELSKSEQQIKALKDHCSAFDDASITRDLTHLRQVIEDIHIPPEYKGSPGLYVTSLENTCRELNRDLEKLQQSHKDMEERYLLTCTQMEQMLSHPELRVVVRDVNGTLLNGVEQHREISDAYETVIRQLFQTIRDLSSGDPRIISGLSIQNYITATTTVDILQANLRTKELEVYKLNRMISDLKKANTEILMLAPPNE